MASMNGLNSIWSSVNTNDYSYLFSGLSSNDNSSSSDNILGIDFAEYSSVTKGSYSKLMKAYYAKYGKDDPVSKEVFDADKKELTSLKGNADELYKAAEDLTASGRDSLFQKVDVKDEETGVTTKGYDVDKIYEAVNTLAGAYNSLVEKATDSSDNAVLRQTLHMIQSTSSNGSLLADVGIKIGADNKLSVDEETFKNADMASVKTLLNGSDSLGGKIQSAASSIYVRTGNSLSDQNTYTSSGTLGNYTTGNILDSFL